MGGNANNQNVCMSASPSLTPLPTTPTPRQGEGGWGQEQPQKQANIYTLHFERPRNAVAPDDHLGWYLKVHR